MLHSMLSNMVYMLNNFKVFDAQKTSKWKR